MPGWGLACADQRRCTEALCIMACLQWCAIQIHIVILPINFYCILHIPTILSVLTMVMQSALLVWLGTTFFIIIIYYYYSYSMTNGLTGRHRTTVSAAYALHHICTARLLCDSWAACIKQCYISVTSTGSYFSYFYAVRYQLTSYWVALYAVFSLIEAPAGLYFPGFIRNSTSIYTLPICLCCSNQSISTYLVPRLHKFVPTRHYKCHHSTRIVKTSAVIKSHIKKIWVLIICLNPAVLLAERIDSGRLFHVFGVRTSNWEGPISHLRFCTWFIVYIG